MTGLSSALSSALSGLLTTASQSAVVSRNVTRASDADYTRKDLSLTTGLLGHARNAAYVRSADKALLDRVLASQSSATGAQTIREAMQVLSATVGDPKDENSVAAGVMALQQSLRSFEDNPSSRAAALDAVGTAKSLVSRINAAATEIANLRIQSDAAVATGVANINALLEKLKSVDELLRGSSPGTENHVDNLDERDAILKQLSQELGLRVVNKSDGGVALYTDSGITLFDKVPRVVEVRNPSPVLPGQEGASVFIDGVQVSGAASVLPLKQGRLAAQIAVRDGLAMTAAAQMDEIARGLIASFAESDQGALPTLPDATGLFTYGGGPNIPAAAISQPGLALGLQLNAAFDVSAGGNPFLLRDGGSNGTAYGYNVSSQSGFQERLSQLVDILDTPMAFDAAAGLAPQASLKQFATSSASDIQGRRADASAASDRSTAAYQRWTEAYLGKTGVNLDEEMSQLLALEKSYQASAKVMSTVDQMFATLVNIVR
jgi:flagellar hook-associated protein 1